MCKQAEHGLGAGRHTTVGVDEVDRAGKTVGLEAGTSLDNFRGVRRQVVDLFSAAMTPSRDPESTESAVAVEDEERAVTAHGDILFDSRPEAP